MRQDKWVKVKYCLWTFRLISGSTQNTWHFVVTPGLCRVYTKVGVIWHVVWLPDFVMSTQKLEWVDTLWARRVQSEPWLVHGGFHQMFGSPGPGRTITGNVVSNDKGDLTVLHRYLSLPSVLRWRVEPQWLDYIVWQRTQRSRSNTSLNTHCNPSDETKRTPVKTNFLKNFNFILKYISRV